MENVTNISTENITTTMILSSVSMTTEPENVEAPFQVCSNAESCLWTIFSPIIFIVGIFGNILNVLILIRLKFHNNATLCLLFILSFADMVVLCVGPTRSWISNTFNVDIRDLSGFSCKFHLFLIYFSMHMSSWILALVTFVRFVKTVLLDQRYARVRRLVTVKNSLTIAGVLALFLAALDFHYFFTNGIINGECNSLTDAIFHFEEFIFTYLDLVFLVILPGLIMITLNTLIILKIRKIKSNKRNSVSSNGSGKEKQKPVSKMTRMLIFISAYFVIANLPICIYFIVDSYVRPGASAKVEMELDLGNAIVYLFQFSHFAINFYFYTATNKRFRVELKTIITKAKRSIFTPVNTSEPCTNEGSSGRDLHLRKSSRSNTGDS